MAAYLNAPPLFPGAAANTAQSLWLDLGGTLLWLILVWAIFIRPMLLNVAQPAVQFLDANPDDFPKLDRTAWDDYSAQLEALGFVQVRDVKTSNAVAGGISRVFLHPESGCYGSVFQVFARRAPELSFGFLSYLGEDWSIGHGISKPIPGQAITRLPHRLGFSRPGMSPEQLYAEHLAARDKIAHDLGLAVVTPQGFETYQERTDLEAQQRRDVIRKSNPVVLAMKVYWAKLKPLPMDWLGDYPREMEARTGQKFVMTEA
jgi:hypothetical protein